MPVTKGTYSNYEVQIYNALIDAGLNTAAACGVLSNLYAESGFNPINLQNSYENSLGYTDATYTKAVNSKSYIRFAEDSAGYGLAQWTYITRKKAMYQYIVQKKKTSIGNLKAQVEFLIMELKGETTYKDFKKVWERLLSVENSPQGAYDAGYNFCRDFEKPAGGATVYRARGEIARDSYWKHYSSDPKESSSSVRNIGSEIVKIAKAQVGKSYIEGGYMYNTENKGADNPGLIYYCYTEVGMEIPQSTTKGYHSSYKGARQVSLDDISAGDLLFYDTDSNIGNGVERVAIATGTGSIIYSDESSGIVESKEIGTPSHAVRILADSETKQGSMDTDDIFSDLSNYEYTQLSSSNSYSMEIAQNLSRVEAVGFDTGHLIDMDHGGEFKFYIPEFTEQAGAQWSTVDIRGRSVEVKSYESTSSRNITVSLELYAGVGLYAPGSGESGEDTVSRLHKDVNFVKSLEYPDYTNAITRPPSMVHLILGSAVEISGVVSNVTVEHLKPLDSQNRAMYIKLSFTVTQVAVNPPDWTDIRGGRHSITSTSDVDSLSLGVERYTNAPFYAEGDN